VGLLGVEEALKREIVGLVWWISCVYEDLRGAPASHLAGWHAAARLAHLGLAGFSVDFRRFALFPTGSSPFGAAVL
jgi:hypothetical protein